MTSPAMLLALSLKMAVPTFEAAEAPVAHELRLFTGELKAPSFAVPRLDLTPSQEGLGLIGLGAAGGLGCLGGAILVGAIGGAVVIGVGFYLLSVVLHNLQGSGLLLKPRY